MDEIEILGESNQREFEYLHKSQNDLVCYELSLVQRGGHSFKFERQLEVGGDGHDIPVTRIDQDQCCRP